MIFCFFMGNPPSKVNAVKRTPREKQGASGSDADPPDDVSNCSGNEKSSSVSIAGSPLTESSGRGSTASSPQLRQVDAQISAVKAQIEAKTKELENLRAEVAFNSIDHNNDRTADIKHTMDDVQAKLLEVQSKLSKNTKVATDLHDWFADNATRLQVNDPQSAPSAYLMRLLASCDRRAEGLSASSTRIGDHCRQIPECTTAAVSAPQVGSPVPPQITQQGMRLFQGFLTHPAFGPTSVELVAELDLHSGRGRWHGVGMSQEVEILHLADQRIVLRDALGAATRLEGIFNEAGGMMHGEVVHNNVRAGNFLLRSTV